MISYWPSTLPVLGRLDVDEVLDVQTDEQLRDFLTRTSRDMPVLLYTTEAVSDYVCEQMDNSI